MLHCEQSLSQTLNVQHRLSTMKCQSSCLRQAGTAHVLCAAAETLQPIALACQGKPLLDCLT